jgi:pilus assembly protein Flp/PilA
MRDVCRDVLAPIEYSPGLPTMTHPAMCILFRLVNDEHGATAIEYALIAAGIALPIIGAVQSLGTSLSNVYSDVASTV